MPVKPPKYKVGDIIYCTRTGELGNIRDIIPNDGTWIGTEEYWIRNFKGFREPHYSSRGCDVSEVVPIPKDKAKILVEYKNQENDAYDEYRYTCQKSCAKQFPHIKEKENEAHREYRFILEELIKKHRESNK